MTLTMTLIVPAAGSARAANVLDPCLPSHSSTLPRMLAFQTPFNEGLAGSWYGGPGMTTAAIPGSHADGNTMVRISRTPKSPGQRSIVRNCVHVDFKGKTITLRARVRTSDVHGFATLWMRENGTQGKLISTDMRKERLSGTKGWHEYSINLPIKSQAGLVYFGALLSGAGTVLVSDLQLQVDGKPMSRAPLRETVNDSDRQFDKGSGITIKKLSNTQIVNLVTLGKVWGFLKYYDPAVTSGKKQWDFALFRIMPTILAAHDLADANAALARWVEKLGPIKPCHPCVHLDAKGLQLHPDLAWIRSSQRLGSQLSDQLQRIYKNRRPGAQFYVGITAYGTPNFTHERTYKDFHTPDAGFRLLTLYRFWNMIEYWYPYRNVIGQDWNQVLADFIPKFAEANTHQKYVRQTMALVASIHDTHANLWSALSERPPIGKCFVPVKFAPVEEQPVVTGFVGDKSAKKTNLQFGDVITSIDGQPVYKLEKDWTPYYGASNTASLQRQLVAYLTRGPCGPVELGVRRDGHLMEVRAHRIHLKRKDWGAPTLNPTSVLTGPAFKLLSPKVAYLNLSRAKQKDIPSYINQAHASSGLIIDDRSEPAEGMFDLPGHLVAKATTFSRLTGASLDTPGAFHWSGTDGVKPQAPRFSGKVVILVNRHTQSYGEYLAMALRADPHAIVVGNPTAGADGVMSRVTLPGGLYANISGFGVFYPDKQPTQRIGIIPDVIVRPTVAGIRSVRDQVLEAAIRQIVGPDVSLATIEKMYQPEGDSKAN